MYTLSKHLNLTSYIYKVKHVHVSPSCCYFWFGLGFFSLPQKQRKKKQFNCDIRPVVGEGSLSESPTLENVSGLDSDESGNGTVCLPYILIKKK